MVERKEERAKGAEVDSEVAEVGRWVEARAGLPEKEEAATAER